MKKVCIEKDGVVVEVPYIKKEGRSKEHAEHWASMAATFGLLTILKKINEYKDKE